MTFLPMTKAEAGGTLDFIIISGDAYVDHPSFGHALIGRLLEAQGFSVGIIAQPQSKEDYCALGEPKLAFLISPGVVDSMVNNYTASKKKRHNDEYSPGNRGFMRPDRALIVYSKTLKEIYPNAFVIAGGVEASLRRFSHYDYWNDSVMPSVMFDSKCDLLIYGAGERPFWDICALIKKGASLPSIKDVRGTCVLTSFDDLPKLAQGAFSGDRENFIILDSHSVISSDKAKHAKAFKIQYEMSDPFNAKGLIQEQPNKTFLIQNPPQFPLSQSEMDEVYALPFEREWHPSYTELGGVKALEEVKFSITSHRGCYGDCSFCSITYHMGRIIQNRSKQSILKEGELLTSKKDFKGYIHDLGGPSANFQKPSCKKQETHGVCQNRRCVGFEACDNLVVDHGEYLETLRELRKLPRVKKVFIRSGVRFDYLLMDENEEFFKELVEHHVSGQLKTAPEHMSDKVLRLMNKPRSEVYKRFADKFNDYNRKIGKKQYIVPYFISSHPGAEIKDAVELTKYLKSINYMPLQVQDFYPTPSTRSTVMYYTGIDPLTGEKVHIPTEEERKMQRALLQYRKDENAPLVRKALILSGNSKLIGNDKNCIIGAAKQTLQGSSKGSTGKGFVSPKKMAGKSKNTFGSSKNQKRK